MINRKLKKIINKSSYLYFILIGVRDTWQQLKNIPTFKHEFKMFNQMAVLTNVRFKLKWEDREPYFTDKTDITHFDNHYIYHPAWAARILANTKPALHIDISSTLHFCSIVSAFIPVDFYDYRPANLKLEGLHSSKGDLQDLPFSSSSVSSISCMHTIEHVGLGRYGDPIDYNGDIKAINELIRVTKPRGDILFVTPVGKPVIKFNAHRIYSYEQITEYFKGCELKDFSLIPDNGPIITNADPVLVKDQTYGCGCFWFKKL